jgi:hypothetical protein
MIEVSQQNIPPRLRPRHVRVEKTAEQLRQERWQQLEDCLEALLHTYFKPRPIPPEEVYGGDLTTRQSPETDFLDQLGLELEPDFVSWMSEHRLMDHDLARQMYAVKQALGGLQENHPYWHLVVSTHSRMGWSLEYIADLWEHGDHKVNDAYHAGMAFLLLRLNPDLTDWQD